jgi:hypothetical protein
VPAVRVASFRKLMDVVQYKYHGFVERFSRIRDSLSTIKLRPTITQSRETHYNR